MFTRQAAAAAAPPVLPTAQEIEGMYIKCSGLLRTMSARQAGGAARSGRYPKHDTARKKFVESVALPGLIRGQMPSIQVQRMLFEMPEPRLIEGTDKAEMDSWSRRILNRQNSR